MNEAADILLNLEGAFNEYRPHIASCMASIFQVPRGQVTMLLGRNGAGKTTTLRTIMGLWKARLGKIMFNGQGIIAR